MSAAVKRSYGRMKNKLKKHNLPYENDIKAFREVSSSISGSGVGEAGRRRRRRRCSRSSSRRRSDEVGSNLT